MDSSHTGTMMLDAPREPKLHFRFHPAHGTQPYAHPAWEPALRLKLVDHRASEAGDFAHLRQAQNLDSRYGCGGLNSGSSSAGASCHTRQDYPSRMNDHEAGTGGKIRQYLCCTETTAGIGCEVFGCFDLR